MRPWLVVISVCLASCTATQDFATPLQPAPALPEAGPAPATLPCNTQSDPANCGACGHGCLGAACSAGVCQPIRLADRHWTSAPLLSGSDRGTTAPLLLDEGGVLWADEAGVWRVERTGGVITSLVAPMWESELGTYRARIDELTSQGGELFLLSHEAGRIWRSMPDGTGIQPFFVDREPISVNGLAVDDAHVAWGRWAGGVYMCPRAGCPATGPTRLGNETNDVFFLELFGKDVLYTAGYGIGATLRTSEAAGGPSRALVEDIGFVGGLATDDADAFVLGSKGFIARVPLRGGEAKRDILTGPRVSQKSGIAVDESFVYWADEGQKAVLRAPKRGGDPEVVVANVVRPFAVAVDAVAVYYTTQGSEETGPQGAVMKVAKPAARP